MYRIFLLPLIIFINLCELSGRNFIIMGYIHDKETGDSLDNVNILYGNNLGIVGTLEGTFILELQQGNYLFKYSRLGYRQQENYLKLNSDTVIYIQMSPLPKTLNEIVVSASKTNNNIEQSEFSSILLKAEAIRKYPSFLGEVDLLRAIQLLPGVQSAGDGNTGFMVRGGNSDQNLILLDGAVVFNSSHLFNFFSIFNSDAIEDMKLHKGGILPEYGGRLSSVVEIRTKTGDIDEYKLTGGIGLISSRLTLETPLQPGRSSFMISGRRTYADLILKLSSDELQRNTRLFFYDLNSGLNFTINENNRISISGYHGKDVTQMSEFFGFNWGNTTASIRWNRIISPSFFSNVSVLYSNYHFNISGDIDPFSFSWQQKTQNFKLKSEFSLFINSDNTLTFGGQSIYHNLNPGNIVAESGSAFVSRMQLSPNNGLEHGAYINNVQKLFDNKVELSYGMRFSLFQVTGPGNHYLYDRTDSSEWKVSDTISLQNRLFYNVFPSWEPRINFRYKFSERASVKGSYHQMTQYIQQASSTKSVAPYDVWFSVSNNIPPQYSSQTAVGWFRNFLSDKIETSVEAYYKDIKNVTDIIDNGNILGNELLESQLRIGKGWAYGVEMLLQKPAGAFNGFVGYTWAVSRRKIEGINNDRSYHSPNDRRHDLSMSGSYSFTPRFIVGMNFIYATGTVTTLPVGKMYYENTWAPIFSERNSSRLADYHRLDLSITWTPKKQMRDQRRLHNSWNLSVFNVYGRINPISVSFMGSNARPGKPNTSIFYIPGPMPALTWNFNF
jgi:hypothetical protein